MRVRSPGISSVGRLVAALSAVTFVAGHGLFYLLYSGANSAVVLSETGHDIKWSLAVVSVAALAVALLALAARELIRLSRLARTAAPEMHPRITRGRIRFVRDFAWLWLGTLAFGAALFVAVENAERISVGLAAPGLSVVNATHWADPMLILEAVGAAVALVATLYRWRRDALVAFLDAVRKRRWPVAKPAVRRRVADSLVAHLNDALTPPGRAPPLVLRA